MVGGERRTKGATPTVASIKFVLVRECSTDFTLEVSLFSERLF